MLAALFQTSTVPINHLPLRESTHWVDYRWGFMLEWNRYNPPVNLSTASVISDDYGCLCL